MIKYDYLPNALLSIVVGVLLASSSVLAEPANSKRLRELDFTSFQSELNQFNAKDLARVEKLVANQSIPQLQGHLKAGRLTAEQLALFYLSRIQNFDQHLRSYTELNPQVLDQARAADALRASGRVLGPMHGIPVNLKDNIETQSPMHTTGGAEILLNSSPAKDAPLVAQLRQQGAIILGKASLSEFAGVVTAKNPGSNAVSGAGHNPHLSKLPVLGSSSGSGISTAASLTVVSVGTETSGSLIAPATINGVVGMKPSRGLVSGKGIIPLIHFQDSAGPVARSVTDAAILLDAIDTAKVDYSKKLDPKALSKVRVGVLAELKGPNFSQPGGVLPRIQKGLKQSGAVQVEINSSLKQPDLSESLMLGLAVDTVGYLEKTVGQIHSLSDLQSYNAAEPARRIPPRPGLYRVCNSESARDSQGPQNTPQRS